MAGLFPQHAVDNLRAANFLIAIIAIHGTHVLLDHLPHRPTLGVPEHHTGCFILHMEQIKLLAELAMVALLRLIQTEQVSFQIFFLRPCRTVNTLQHLVLGIAAPISTGHLHQLEHLELAG